MADENKGSSNISSRTKASIDDLRRRMEKAPADVQVLLLQSIRLLEQGKLADAIAGFERVVSLDPMHAVAFNCMGIAHFNLGAIDKAIACYDKAISIRPYFAEAFSNRGSALGRLGRDADALADCESALTMNPRLAEAHNNLGNLLMKKGMMQRAVTSFEAAIELAPRFDNAINNLILAKTRLGALKDAKVIAAKALEANPNNLVTRIQAADIEVTLGAPEKAIALLEPAVERHKTNPHLRNALAMALLETGASEAAIAHSREAIKLDPNSPKPYISIGAGLIQLGRFDEALPYYDKALQFPGEFSGTFHDLAKAKKFKSNDDPHLRLMEAALEKEKQAPNPNPAVAAHRRVGLSFSLGKAYDDLGRYEEAFRNFSAANEIEQRAMPYDEGAVMGRLAGIKKLFTREFLDDPIWAGRTDASPIFVLGMPRSGTTLAEQILGGCKNVHNAGELPAVGDLCRRLADSIGEKYPDFVRAATPAQIARFGKDYMHVVEGLAPAPKRTTDKMPQNFLYAGLIHLGLPNAKIVHTIRDPRDTCLSCFMTPWKHMEKFNTDLRRLGRYYRAYVELMAHWRSVLPATAFLDVQYEELTADPVAQTKRITDFCGLEWSPAVVEIERREGVVRTASIFQARQSIYKTSVARWRHYEPWLGPLIEELGDVLPS